MKLFGEYLFLLFSRSVRNCEKQYWWKTRNDENCNRWKIILL